MTPDQGRRLRECAFDQDITDALAVAHWFDDSMASALAECMSDIREILEESG